MPGSVISRVLLLADLEAHETLQRHPGIVEYLLHRLLGVTDVRLLEQHAVLEEARHAAVDDLAQGLLRLAFLTRRRLGDASLVLDDVARDLVAGEVRRVVTRDLHRRTARGVKIRTVEVDQNTD